MPTCPIPSHPHLDHFRSQAKVVQRAVRAGDAWGLGLVAEFHPAAAADPAAFNRADAQVVIARQHAQPDWAALRAQVALRRRYGRSPHLDPVEGPVPEALAERVDRFLRLSCLTYGADSPARRDAAAALLAAEPALGTASIHTAAVTGDVAAAEALLTADPTLATAEGGPWGWPPLLYLACGRLPTTKAAEDSVVLADLLLAAGADPDAGYLWEGLVPPMTALTGAFGEGEQGPVNQPRHPRSIELATLLLDAGADPNDHQALYNRHFRDDDDHLELLLARGMGTGDGGPWRRLLGDALPTPAQGLAEELDRAVTAARPARVRLLLAHGAPVADGMLREAMLAGSIEVAAALRGAGAPEPSLDAVEGFVATAMAGDAARVDALTAADPSLPARAVAAHPDLVRRAAELGASRALPVLVAAGFDLDARRRTTALHDAAWRGDVAMVEQLLALGADPRITDEEHDATPLGWAEHGGRDAVAAVLRRVGG